VNGWQFVVHQEALETIDHLRPAERRSVWKTLRQLVENPWQLPDGQIRPPNDRIYLVKNVGSLRVVYWLDAFERQVYIVRLDLPK
jgi:mRNA-degrading endonuclease RelE of RelBE toxin-antitoxin system